MGQERRKFKRIRIDKLSKLDSIDCQIVNVSKEGLLLVTQVGDKNHSDEKIKVKLKIQGEWIRITAIVVWRIQDEKTQSVSLGAYIKDPPPEYKEYLDQLYFEASEN